MTIRSACGVALTVKRRAGAMSNSSRPFIDISGKKFGRLLAIRRHGVDGQRLATFWCICDCGSEGVFTGRSLRSGSTKSCGCLKKEMVRYRNFRHGHAQRNGSTPEYAIWNSMRKRCRDPNDMAYMNYGGRGITVCKEWMEDFMQFYSDMGPRPDSRYSIDRIDNDEGYSPSNCRWATRSQQNRNTRAVRKIARGDGVIFDTLTDAAIYVGGDVSNIRKACIGKLKTAYGYAWSYASLDAKPMKTITDEAERLDRE